jgi:cell shape-determining protein MreC
MKNFSFRTKKNSPLISEGRRVILRALLYTVIAVIAVVALRSFVSPVVSNVVASFMHLREYLNTSTAAFPTYVRERSELEVEIIGLREELAAQSGDRATVGKLAAENEELRALLGDTPDERILAGVIARPPRTPYDVLILDRGSEQGVTEGAIVYHVRDHALGIVGRVFPRMSLVTLFSSPGVESTVYLYGPDVYAYAYGEGGGVIRISLPQGIDIKEGDPVVLPSLHMGDLGVVERVVSVPTQPEQNAYLTFPVPIQSLRTVTVSRDSVTVPDLEALRANVERVRGATFVEVPEALRLGTATTSATSTAEREASSQ